MAKGDELDFSKPARVFFFELDSTIAYNKKRLPIAGSNFFRVGNLPASLTNVSIAMQRDNPGSFVPYFAGEGVHTGDNSRESLDALFITSAAQPPGSAPIIIKYGTYPIGALIFNQVPLPFPPPAVKPRILHQAISITGTTIRTSLLATPAASFVHVTRFWYKQETKVAGGWNLELYFGASANYAAAAASERIRIYRNPFEQGNLEPKSQDFIYGASGPTSPTVGFHLSARMVTSIATAVFIGIDYYLTTDGVSL